MVPELSYFFPAHDEEANVGGLVAEALEALPPDYRQVIVLRHFDGLPFADVAAAMGRSVDSVEKLWVRALGRLRRTLETADEPDRT